VWSAALATGTAPGTNGAEARANGYLAPGLAPWPDTPDAQVLDLTDPAVRAWWTAKHVDFIRRWDISAIKLDRGEEYVTRSRPTSSPTAAAAWRCATTSLCSTWSSSTTRSKPRAAPATSSSWRASAYGGAQQCGIVWGGDSPGSTAFGAGPGTDLGCAPRSSSQQRAAFLGFPFWGSDTGGYYEFKQRDVFARWLRVQRLLRADGDRRPRQPRAVGHAHRADLRRRNDRDLPRYVRLHHDLIPYTMRQRRGGCASGLPIARPLVFAYPDDPAVRDRWDEYLFGATCSSRPCGRTAPRSRDVYLPLAGGRTSGTARGPSMVRRP
jgi:alpha-glucosidase (family GH31 glycosyl hydrolase)